MRVLITRPRTQSHDFARRLEMLGAVPTILPVIDVRPPADWGATDAAIDRLRTGQYDWLVFTSANGVTAFFERVRSLGRDVRVVGRAQLASIGSATADALAGFNLISDVSSTDDMRSERLLELLLERCRGSKVMLAGAAQSRELLRERLKSVATVDSVAVYEQVNVVDAMNPIFEQLRRGEFDVVTLTSPNIARAFLDACDDTTRRRLRDGTTQIVCNSLRLEEQLRKDGIPSKVAADPTVEGLIAALHNLVPRLD